MSETRTDPVIRQLELAQEATRAMWRTYELHFGSLKRDAEWQAKAKELFARCQDADNMVHKLKELRARMIGWGDVGGRLEPWSDDAQSSSNAENPSGQSPTQG